MKKGRKTEKHRRRLPIRLTAYHEGGHAVVAYILHRRFGSISIVPEEDVEGRITLGKAKYIEPDWDTSRRCVIELEKRAMVLCAGVVAERLFTGRRHWKGSENDITKAVDYLAYQCGNDEEVSAYLELIWIRTRNLLRLPQHWAAVEAVAEELLKNSFLGQRRVRGIIFDAMHKSDSFVSTK
jgi:ATP-dependent Zn protease